MRFITTGLIALSVAACAESVTAPQPFDGGLAFSYTGAIAGTFNAKGAVDSTNKTPWAGAGRIEGTPMMVLAAAVPRSQTTHDIVAVVVPRNTPGTSTIATICPPEGCADLYATFGRANGDGNDYLTGCYIVSGSVTIATITATRVTGSFSGTGQCISKQGAETTFQVLGGEFDLPILDEPASLSP